MPVLESKLLGLVVAVLLQAGRWYCEQTSGVKATKDDLQSSYQQ